MTEKEKRDEAKKRLALKIVENILFLAGKKEIIEGPRGEQLLKAMQDDTYHSIAKYENRYFKADE